MTSPAPTVDYTDTVRRPAWSDLPAGVRAAVAEVSGSPVVAAQDPPRSGFTGGFAAVLELHDGRRVFAKAGSSVNPHLTAAYAQEAVVLAALPAGVPAPALVGAGHLRAGAADDHEWRVVVAESVDGHLPQPWAEGSVAAVHEGCLAAAAALTRTP